MGYTKEKKEKRKKIENKPGVFSKIKKRWLQKRPVLFFVLIFAVLMVLFYWLWLSRFFNDHIQLPITSVNAAIASFVLNIFGMGTQASGDTIFSPEFSTSVRRGCDAIEAMALFGAALLAFPSRWKYKLIGFFAGIFLLWVLNVVRIVSLFLTGVYYPKAFDMMHLDIWQVLFILFAIGLWIVWIWQTTKRKIKANAAN